MDHETYTKRAAIRLLAGLALVLVFVAQPAAAPHTARAGLGVENALAPSAAVTLIVDRNDDIGGLACTAADNDCTLRSAIQIANGDAAHRYSIYFAADYTITLGNPLAITANDLVVTGSGPDLTSRTIKIDAAGFGQAFIVSGMGDYLSSLRIYGAGVGTANIYLTGSAYGAAIWNSVIGDDDPADGCQAGSSSAYGGIYIDATGSNPNPEYYARAKISSNVIECHGGSPGNGIDVVGTNDVVIGTEPGHDSVSSDRNFIRANAGDGIHISGSNATNNTIAYNIVGTNTAGSAAAANGQVGIYMGNLSNNTVITGNLISGNSWAGVWLDNTRAVTITNNTIGANIGGTAAVPNGHDGVAITDGASGNVIGLVDEVASPNLISGNTQCGVRIRDGATANLVDGNRIGLNAAGNAAIPNGHAGVCIFNANGNYVGTSLAGVNQFISGNTREGVYVENTNDTWIGQTNYIGVASDWTTPLGNGLQGVMLVSTTNTLVFSRRVFYNGGAGIALTGPATAVGNELEPGAVYGNVGLPVDLGNDGPTPNDPDDADSGPNTLLNYPVINASAGSIVTGTACANCRVVLYRAVGDPARPGGGGVYISRVTAGASGVWTATLPTGLTSANIIVQTQDVGYNTSELSPRPVVYVPLVLKN